MFQIGRYNIGKSRGDDDLTVKLFCVLYILNDIVHYLRMKEWGSNMFFFSVQVRKFENEKCR